MIKGLQAQRRSEWGFTLIEVMVVIIMIGILAAIAVPIYTGYVYRARASEGVTTLGAVKTFLLERRNATGEWPTGTQIMDEFNEFKELYYFGKELNTGIIVTYGTGGVKSDRISVRLIPSDKFDAPTDLTNAWIQINIDWSGVEANSGWSGDIVDKYAKHLPPCSSPLNS